MWWSNTLLVVVILAVSLCFLGTLNSCAESHEPALETCTEAQMACRDSLQAMTMSGRVIACSPGATMSIEKAGDVQIIICRCNSADAGSK